MAGIGGRLVGGAILAAALGAGAAMYWLQVYAYYDRLDPGQVVLTVTGADGPVPIAATGVTAIDSDSSPIRFRACFTVADPAALIAGARPAVDAVPLNAPGWFDCFDAPGLGADLAAGRATALVGRENAVYGIDRIVAVYPDGRAVAWDQINACGKEVFDGNPPPPGCPPAPG